MQRLKIVLDGRSFEVELVRVSVVLGLHPLELFLKFSLNVVQLPLDSLSLHFHVVFRQL